MNFGTVIMMMPGNDGPRMIVPVKADDSVLRSHPDDLATEEVGRRQKGFKRKRSPTMSFPATLHEMLEDAESRGYAHIISWLPDGTRFKIRDPSKFRDEIMRKYFRQTKLESFTRQLYIYGFSKDSGFKKEDMVFVHPQFKRGNIDACKKIGRNQSGDRRVKRKENETKHSSGMHLHKQSGRSPNGSPVQQRSLKNDFPWTDHRSIKRLQSAVQMASDTNIRGQTFLGKIEPLSVTELDLEPRPIEEMLQDYNKFPKKS